MKRTPFFFLVILLLASARVATAVPGKVLAPDIGMQVSATVQKAPPRIALHWVNTPSPGIAYTGYTLYRKSAADSSWGQPLASLPGDATQYTDGAVRVGEAYEYQIVRAGVDNNTAPPAPFYGYGYLYSGIEAPSLEHRGTLLLLVDDTHATALRDELARLQQDLVGDGWFVQRHDVSPALKDYQVKALIKADYQADPQNVKALFLFGHIAVPYAGDIDPDGHTTHQGAWAADMYYGDMTGTWTDTTLDTTANGPQRWGFTRNVPGDGKWDQSNLPPDGKVCLQIGRVDLSDLPAFQAAGGNKDETALLRQYLEKDHRYRHNLPPFNTVPRRALFDDNYQENHGRPYAVALSTTEAFFGPVHADTADWRATLPRQSYLWAFGFATGNYDGVTGVITTAQAATLDLRAVFTMIMGSWSGDWNVSDNVMRALLGSQSYCLSCAWSGPRWYYHHMALGETLGYAAQLTQNNRGFYPNPLATPFSDKALAMVHIALLGDPTLRLFPVTPPADLTAERQEKAVRLTWTASPDPVAGYYIYRADDPAGRFTRITKQLVTDTRFTDDTAPAGTQTYLVRAIELETTGSGSYYNPSQGIFAQAQAR